MLLRDFYRSRLSTRGKQCYDILLQNIRRLASDGSVYVPGRFDNSAAEDLFAAYYALREDRPEYYFLTNRVRSSRTENGITLFHEIRFTRDHMKRINNLLRRTIGEITDGCDGQPVVERERIVYSRIAARYFYDNNDYSHDLSGLLLLNSGVCEALSAVLVLSLREVGIPAMKLKGFGKNAWHSWTVVMINGQALHLDVTWDLSSRGNPSCFRYFNLTEGEITRDHTLHVDEWRVTHKNEN